MPRGGEVWRTPSGVVGRSLLHCAYSLDHPDPLEMRLLCLQFRPHDDSGDTREGLGELSQEPYKDSGEDHHS